MGVSNTFPKLGGVHYGMDPIGLKSGRAGPKIGVEMDTSAFHHSLQCGSGEW